MRLEKYKTEEEKLEAVKQDGWVIHYIKNPSEEETVALSKKYQAKLNDFKYTSPL